MQIDEQSLEKMKTESYGIDFNYMTDYSEGEEDDEEVLHYHHISWRSDSKLIIHTVSKLYIKIIELNKLVKKLDKRRTITKKLIRRCPHSEYPPPANPPANPPAWALKTNGAR